MILYLKGHEVNSSIGWCAFIGMSALSGIPSIAKYPSLIKSLYANFKYT